MSKYNQDDYDFIEDEEFQAFLKNKLGEKFVPRYKFFTILNRCKREYIHYLNHPAMFKNTPLY